MPVRHDHATHSLVTSERHKYCRQSMHDSLTQTAGIVQTHVERRRLHAGQQLSQSATNMKTSQHPSHSATAAVMCCNGRCQDDREYTDDILNSAATKAGKHAVYVIQLDHGGAGDSAIPQRWGGIPQDRARWLIMTPRTCSCPFSTRTTLPIGVLGSPSEEAASSLTWSTLRVSSVAKVPRAVLTCIQQQQHPSLIALIYMFTDYH